MTTETFVLSEEMVAGPARLRIDVLGGEPREHVLDDMSFMDYRLADVRIAPEATLPEPDVVWSREGEKGIAYDRRAQSVERVGQSREIELHLLFPQKRLRRAGAAAEYQTLCD